MTALAVLTGLAYADDPPTEGTFWSAAKTNEPAYPFNFAPELPAIQVDTNSWLIDDTTVDYSSFLYQSNLPDPPTGDEPPGEDIPGTNSTAMIYGTNDFWIEILAVTNDLASLALHNVRSNWYGQILSRTNIEDAAWRLGPYLQNTDGTNFLAFDPLPTFGLARTFYRGVEGFPVVSVRKDQYFPEAIEPGDTNSSGQVGIFNIVLSDTLSTNLTVCFRLSGVALNGTDYTNLSASVTVPSNNISVQVFVQPLYDGLLEFDEPVTLTLLLTNGYVVDSTNAALTVFIKDNLGTDVVGTVLTNLVDPVGIDYHAPSNFVLLSVNHPGGIPSNFARVYTNGTNAVVTNWSGIAGVQDEVKLATVKQTLSGFTNGDMFFGSDTNVGWLSADGTASNLNWCVLTNAVVTNASHLRGSLYVDRSGTFSNNLIAVTSGEDYSLIPRGVWMVNAQAQPRLLANILATHLEGAITITNDSAKWGPWAGRILTGDEQLGVIFSVDTNGVAEAFDLRIDPEDFDIVPPDQDLYCVNIGEGSLLKVSRNVLTNHVGSLLITQAGEYHNQPPGLFVVSWNSTNSLFEARRISLPAGMGGTFEHVTFAPLNLPVLTP